MPISDLQQLQRELGRIRIGKRVGSRPEKLEKFRFTSASEELIQNVAALYGGEVKPWNNDGKSEFEVYTAAMSVPILIPNKPITQWYEMWSAGGCQRRCTGELNILTGGPCLCPADHLERALDAAKGKACKATTRLNVFLRDVMGIGVWRLESHGYHSAVKLPGVAEFLARAGDAGVYLPAVLSLVKESSKRPGIGRREWIVPVIDVKATPGELMSGTAPVAIGAPNRPALTVGSPTPTGRPDYVGLATAAATLDDWRDVWKLAGTNGHLDDALKAELAPIGEALRGRQSPAPAEDAGTDSETVDAEIVDAEEDRLWGLVVENAGDWNRQRIEDEFRGRFGGLHPSAANAEQLAEFLMFLRASGGSQVAA